MQKATEKKSYTKAEKFRQAIAIYKAKHQHQEDRQANSIPPEELIPIKLRSKIEPQEFSLDECSLYTHRILTLIRTKYQSKFSKIIPFTELFIMFLLEQMPQALVERILQRTLTTIQCQDQIRTELLEYVEDQCKLTSAYNLLYLNTDYDDVFILKNTISRHTYTINIQMFDKHQSEQEILHAFKVQQLKICKKKIRYSSQSTCTKLFVHLFFLHSEIFRQIAFTNPKLSFLFNDIRINSRYYRTSKFTKANLIEMAQQIQLQKFIFIGPVNLLFLIYIQGKIKEEKKQQELQMDTVKDNLQSQSKKKAPRFINQADQLQQNIKKQSQIQSQQDLILQQEQVESNIIKKTDQKEMILELNINDQQNQPNLIQEVKQEEEDPSLSHNINSDLNDYQSLLAKPSKKIQMNDLFS